MADSVQVLYMDYMADYMDYKDRAMTRAAGPLEAAVGASHVRSACGQPPKGGCCLLALAICYLVI